MERYYSNLEEHFPYTALSIVERLKVYIAMLLYPNERIEDALNKRVLLGNFDDDPHAIRRSIDQFKSTNATFPFTVYSISENENYEWKTNLQVSGNYYSEELEAYISFVPLIFSIPMVTFYSTPFDFWRGRTVLERENATLIRLNVPVTVNDKLTAFTIDITFQIEKGQLAWDIEQQFSYGKLYPLVHTATIKGAFITVNLFTNYTEDIILDANGNPVVDENGNIINNINKPRVIYHVDDIIIQLWNYENKINLKENILIDRWHSPDTPAIVSSTPANNVKNVAVDSIIQFNFNVPMNESSVINNIDILPYFSYDHKWNNDSTILTIIPVNELENDTKYTLLINRNLKSGNTIPLAEDIKLIFTTVE